MELVNKYVPKREDISSEGRKKPILQRSIQKKMKERNKLWKNYKMYPTDKNFVAYKKKRNEVNQAIRIDRDKQRKKILNNCKRNSKKFYGYVRKMQTVRAEVRQLKCNNGTGLTQTDTEAA